LVKERLESINAGYYSAWNSAKEERLAELDELGLRLRANARNWSCLEILRKVQFKD
jgi:hypothetical protein